MKNTEVEASASYLSFRLEEEAFALHVSKVLEILEVEHITKVPHSPDFMRGVVNLRGNILPVIDTRVKFGLAPSEFTVNTCIVVINILSEGEELVLGALVDAVLEVAELKADDIQTPPKIGNKYKSDFINGMVKRGDGFAMLLDIDRIFSSDELIMLKENSETPVAEQ
jgi:purine-binding chemotaxis protein CheW